MKEKSMIENALGQASQYSRYLAQQLQARPWLRSHLLNSLTKALAESDLRDFLSNSSLNTEDELNIRLRELRAWVYSHVIVRDLAGWADLAEVTQTMTTLAEISLQFAQNFHHARLSEQYGDTIDAQGQAIELIVLGMGKLGGGELNVSSDIDLIFLVPSFTSINPERDLKKFFTKLGQRIIHSLSHLDGTGYVFRVDMRLRPDGESGSLVVSFNMLENYLIAHGREWERYAWIKARPLTGIQNPTLQSALQNIVRPFVYRKYLDFGVVDALRDLHAQIRREVARREMYSNIKLGPGGIREIEFIAQVFQLVRGGRETRLQIRPTLATLQQLAELDILSADDVTGLRDAYSFLRRLEHRIQYLDDNQTHSLPQNESDLQRIAHAMGFDDVAKFTAALEKCREFVSQQFEAIFSDPTPDSHALDTIWNTLNPDQDTLSGFHTRMQQQGFSNPQQSYALLQSLRNHSCYTNSNDTTRSRLDTLLPRIIELCAQHANPDTTLLRIVGILETISRRAAYLALLNEYPHALERLVNLASQSSWGADYLARHPILLDDFLDERTLDAEPDWLQFRVDLQQQLQKHADDTERQMDLMRELHHSATFELLGKDLAGHLSVERLSDHLSALADSILDATIDQCWQRLCKNSNVSPLPIHPQFAVIAYGKLGGKEMGYSSDLDLVFIFDEHNNEGELSSGLAQMYARLAQRILTWLSSRTSAGILFETDLRLRPNGEAGLLVSSFNAFNQYQRRENNQGAWLWEHQALTRARFSAGSPTLGARFEALRIEVLCQQRDPQLLAKEIITMRQKMYAAHPNNTNTFNLKHDAGGLIDLEFVVQYLILAHANLHPVLCENLGNITLLKIAADLGLIVPFQAQAAATAYRQLRAIQHQRRLNLQNDLVDDLLVQEHRKAIQTLYQAVLGARQDV